MIAGERSRCSNKGGVRLINCKEESSFTWSEEEKTLRLGGLEIRKERIVLGMRVTLATKVKKEENGPSCSGKRGSELAQGEKKTNGRYRGEKKGENRKSVFFVYTKNLKGVLRGEILKRKGGWEQAGKISRRKGKVAVLQNSHLYVDQEKRGKREACEKSGKGRWTLYFKEKTNTRRKNLCNLGNAPSVYLIKSSKRGKTSTDRSEKRGEE